MASNIKRTGLLIGGILLAAFAGGGLLGAVNSHQGKSDQVEQLLRDGDAKYQQHDLAGALRLYLEAENLKPNSNEISDKIKLVNDQINGGKQVASQNQTNNSGVQQIAAQVNTNSEAQKPEQQEPGKMPNLVGLTKDEAIKQLLDAGLRYAFEIKPSDKPADTVFQQDKEPGQPYAKGDRVTILISSGK